MLKLNSKMAIVGSVVKLYNNPAPVQPIGGSILYLDAGNITSYPGTGTNWYDISGQGMTASLVNTPTYQSTSGSFKLNGTNQYMAVTPNATLNAINGFTNSYTIEVWAKSPFPTLTTHTSTRLIEKRAATGAYPASIQIISSSGQNTLGYIYDGTNIPGVHISSGSQLWDDTWRQVVYVVNSTADDLKSYKDGNFISSSANTTTTNATNTSNFYIGNNGGLTIPFSGEIAIVRVYDTALTNEQININWLATKDRFGV